MIVDGITTPELILDATYERLAGGDIFDAMESLLMSLTALRSSLEHQAWLDFCATSLRTHPVFAFVHQAPFTKRAFDKPRGYPGDAVTLDYIYGVESLREHTGPEVARLSAWEFQTPSCRSVRARKDVLAKHIDDIAALVSRPRVLSLACGHLREARTSEAVLNRAVDFVAVDQDPDSVATVDAQLKEYGVRAIKGSVRAVLAKKLAFQELDLAYAAGLYDYLGQPMAKELSSRLFEMLRSGGRLLIPNFNPTLRDIGYLEGFMDWQLIYRDDDAMLDLASALPANQVAGCELFRESHGNITFLAVTKV
ncbi:MAG TPA: class I SAM-dependent methyltransferase [Vicinamibacterales bacterium]|jgi:hypothetical protein|nr:class I SAM-dependent methyltransferase [Vicinamibacterales bacterium]